MKSRRAGKARVTRDDVPQLERLLTVDQLAELWQVHPRTIRRMIADGRIPVKRLGRAVRIHPKIARRLERV
jgi:excisionase family DNA binding protein